jgi:hypothetical protein
MDAVTVDFKEWVDDEVDEQVLVGDDEGLLEHVSVCESVDETEEDVENVEEWDELKDES